MHNTIFIFYMKYIFCKTRLPYSKTEKIKSINLKLCSKIEAEVSKAPVFSKNLFWRRTKLFQYINLPFFSNAVIFDCEQYKRVTIFSRPFNLQVLSMILFLFIFLCSKSKCQNLYQVSYLSDEISLQHQG